MDLSLRIPRIVDSLKNQGSGSIRAHLDAIPGITNSGNDIESQIGSSDDGGITGSLLQLIDRLLESPEATQVIIADCV